MTFFDTDIVRHDAHAPLSQSPSLGHRHGASAYEMKFLVGSERAAAIQAWAATQLTPDPHADRALGGAYHTTTLYFDTPDLEIFHGTGSYSVRKYRVRRYGAEPWVFLERKMRHGKRVRKRRERMDVGPAPWPGSRFHRLLLLRQLRPVCQIEYERVAFFGVAASGPIRLTIDRRLRGEGMADWTVRPLANAAPLLPDQAICELKYRDTLPAVFKDLISSLQLEPAKVSKYRTCMRTCGLAVPEGERGCSTGSETSVPP